MEGSSSIQEVAIYLVLTIPILAVVGGIVHGIVKTIMRQRMIELAQKERIAALQRGLDPNALPPGLPASLAYDEPGLTFEQSQRRRSQGLMIGGLVSLGAGIGIGAGLLTTGQEEGLIPLLVLSCIGLALLLSAWIVRPTNGGHRA